MKSDFMSSVKLKTDKLFQTDHPSSENKAILLVHQLFVVRNVRLEWH